MRELNFSIPSANKASVGITTALYDRRALDCTSTLPLINSLNNLVYLTTSSARIRDILCVDGGIERLICMLKEGRDYNHVEAYWVWNLAFQTVVNVGVRGSEAVRTRVVEADVVPVLATVLTNYVRVLDIVKERVDAEAKRKARSNGHGGSSRHSQRASEHMLPGQHGSERIRRQAPPPIEIPGRTTTEINTMPAAHSLPNFSLSSPPERTTFGPQAHHHHHVHRHHHHHHHSRTPSRNTSFPSAVPQPSQNANAQGSVDDISLRPVRDEHRLPSMMAPAHVELTSRPESPTTPSAPSNPQSQLHRPAIPLPARLPRRPSIRHQLSVSGVSDDQLPTPAGMPADENETGGPSAVEPVVDIQTDMIAQDSMESDNMLEAAASPMHLGDANPLSDAAEETFNLARSALEGRILAPTGDDPTGDETPIPPPAIPSPGPNAMPFVPGPMNPLYQAAHPVIQQNHYTRYLEDRIMAYGQPSPLPRQEDVLMCLQLLAYVSKYCNLRTYFQETHLVPRLKLSDKQLLEVLDTDIVTGPGGNGYGSKGAAALGRSSASQSYYKHDLMGSTTPRPDAMDLDIGSMESEMEEYTQPQDYNLFPLLEKFTQKTISTSGGHHHSNSHHHNWTSSLNIFGPTAPIPAPFNAAGQPTINQVTHPAPAIGFEPTMDTIGALNPAAPQHSSHSPFTPDMLYWSGVVMRNLCRKDDSRGGIRQCANWKCGKWEEWPRQFAKCRRCRRTKYCCKGCQKSAWGGHRWWCVLAGEGDIRPGTGHAGHSLELGSTSAVATVVQGHGTDAAAPGMQMEE